MPLSRSNAVRIPRSHYWPVASTQSLVPPEVVGRVEDVERSPKYGEPSPDQDDINNTSYSHGPPPDPETNPFLSSDRRAARQARLPHNLAGKKLWLLVGCLFVALLLSTLEQLIIGVALTTISGELGDYRKSSWVVTSYLMAYNSFLMVFARASDIFGRRSTFLAALFIFTWASLACGLSQNMDQLIIFRAFQGVGGAGLYIITLTVATEIPGKARTAINVLIPMGFGVAAGVAPVLGGAIVSHTTWRWVFLLNVPGGVGVAVVTFFVFPKNVVKLYFRWRDFRHIDWLGLLLLVGAVQMLSFALHEADGERGWNNSKTIGTAIGQAFCWAALFAWEWYVTKHEERLEIYPLWPTRLWTGRVMIFAMIAAFFSGFPLYAIYIYLPQRYELVDGLSPLQSGIHFLPTPVAIFTATGVAASISLKKNVSHKIFASGAALQLIGLSLLSTVGSGTLDQIPARTYVYGIVTGFGIGSCLSTITLITRAESGIKDHSVNSAAVSSLRTIGGTVSTGILQTIISGNLLSSLRSGPIASQLSPAQIVEISENPANLSSFTVTQQGLIRTMLGDAFKRCWMVMAGLAAATLVAGLLCLVRHPVNLKALDELETIERDRLDKLAAEAALIEKRRAESSRSLREKGIARLYRALPVVEQPSRVFKEKAVAQLYGQEHISAPTPQTKTNYIPSQHQKGVISHLYGRAPKHRGFEGDEVAHFYGQVDSPQSSPVFNEPDSHSTNADSETRFGLELPRQPWASATAMTTTTTLVNHSAQSSSIWGEHVPRLYGSWDDSADGIASNWTIDTLSSMQLIGHGRTHRSEFDADADADDDNDSHHTFVEDDDPDEKDNDDEHNDDEEGEGIDEEDVDSDAYAKVYVKGRRRS